jgi:hypothetical protein
MVWEQIKQETSMKQAATLNIIETCNYETSINFH